MKVHHSLVIIALITRVELASAVDFEPLGKAIASVLGTAKAFKKTVASESGETLLYYSKTKAGKPERLAFVEKNVYEPNCTHTWIVGIDAGTGKVTEIRPIEMSCPHAFPTRSQSFLSQFKGKGPADAATIEEKVNTIAKATGSCRLAAQAVKKSIVSAKSVKASL